MPEKSWKDLFEQSLPEHPLMREKLKAWHLQVESRAEVIKENLHKFISLEGKAFLDFGCGEGGMAVYFAKQGMAAFGADIGEPQLERSRLRAKEQGLELTTFRIGPDSRVQGAQDESFEVILCHEVIEHCPRPEVTLAEMKRLLQPDGLIYLTSPNRLGPAWIFRDPHYCLPLVALLPKALADPLVKRFRRMDNDVIRLFTLFGLRRLFRRAGLKTVYAYPDEVRAKTLNPGQIKSGFKARAFAALDKMGLARLIPAAMPLLHLFSNTFSFILKKD